jgi:hypothetical protein
MYTRIRELLVERGFAPTSLALAIHFPDDIDSEYVAIASSDGRVYAFVYEYGRRSAAGKLSEWREVTGAELPGCNASRIAFAIRVAKGET